MQRAIHRLRRRVQLFGKGRDFDLECFPRSEILGQKRDLVARGADTGFRSVLARN